MAAVTWSTLLLLRWQESGKLRYGIACELLLALAIYFHYLCATMVLLQVWYLLRRSSRTRWTQVAGLWVVLAMILLPLAPHLRQLWELRVEHSFSGAPSVTDVRQALLYTRLLCGIILGFVLARWVWPGFSCRLKVLSAPPHPFLLIWYIGPILILLTLSLFTKAALFVPRYYSWGLAGLTILIASGLRSIDPLPARRALGLIILSAFVLRPIPTGAASHGKQDWRGALKAADAIAGRSGYMLLLRSGFPERSVSTVDTPPMEDPLMAPLAMYPVRGHVVAVPCWLDRVDVIRWEQIVSGLVSRRAGFVFVSPNDWPLAETWLLGRLSGEDYEISRLGNFTGISAIRFEPRQHSDDLH